MVRNRRTDQDTTFLKSFSHRASLQRTDDALLPIDQRARFGVVFVDISSWKHMRRQKRTFGRISLQQERVVVKPIFRQLFQWLDDDQADRFERDIIRVRSTARER